MPIQAWHLIPACLMLIALVGGGFAAGSVVGDPPNHATTQLFVRTVRVREAVSTVTSVHSGPTTTVRRAPRTVRRPPRVVTRGGSAATATQVITAPAQTFTQLVSGTSRTLTATSTFTETSTIISTVTVPTTVTVTSTETHGHH